MVKMFAKQQNVRSRFFGFCLSVCVCVVLCNFLKNDCVQNHFSLSIEHDCSSEQKCSITGHFFFTDNLDRTFCCFANIFNMFEVCVCFKIQKADLCSKHTHKHKASPISFCSHGPPRHHPHPRRCCKRQTEARVCTPLGRVGQRNGKPTEPRWDRAADCRTRANRSTCVGPRPFGDPRHWSRSLRKDCEVCASEDPCQPEYVRVPAQRGASMGPVCAS